METQWSIFYGCVVLVTGLLLLTAIAFNRRMPRMVKYYLKYSVHILYMHCISIVAIPFALFHPCSSKSVWIYCLLTNPISRILGIRWEIRNASNIIGENQSAIFISNHQCIFDAVGMVRLWYLNSIRCVGLSNNLFFWLWPHGLAMWLCGTIFINRKSTPEKRIQYLNRVAERLFREKDKLWFYVEGTRNGNSEKLLPFKKGAFRLAIDHQVPIIPVVFSPYYFINKNEKRFDSGTCILDILEPISTRGLSLNDLDNLIQKSYVVMSAKYQELENEIRSKKNQKVCHKSRYNL